MLIDRTCIVRGSSHKFASRLHTFLCINIHSKASVETLLTPIRVRSLLIHVNNGAFRSSAKSFGSKTICRREQAALVLHRAGKRENEREEKQERERERERERGKRKRLASSLIQLPSWTGEPIRAIQFQTMSDVEERGANKTRLARLPISSISSTEDQRGIIGFFDVWEATSRF